MKGLPSVLPREKVSFVVENLLKEKGLKTDILEDFLVPMEFMELAIRIKRAFGLSPKIISHCYVLDRVTGEVFRIPSLPELVEMGGGERSTVASNLDIEQAEKAVIEKATKYATRAYKFFWYPEVTITNKVSLLTLFWSVKAETPKKNLNLAVNTFSGQVVKISPYFPS